MMAVFHGAEGDRNVVQPVRRDVHQVDIVPPANFFVCFGTDIGVGLRQSCLLEDPVAIVDPFLSFVTDRDDLYPFDEGISPDGAGSSSADSDKGDPHRVDRVAFEPEGALLSGCTRRGLEFNDSVLDDRRH